MTPPVVEVISLPYAVEMTAVAFGALSGALHATRKGMDIVGVGTLALVCAVGGGIIRDVLLQQGVPVVLRTPTYLAVAALASVVGIFFARAVRATLPVMGVVDTLLIGAWVLLGAERALVTGLTWSAAAFLGVLTATGGGVLRDLLCHDVPAAIQPGQWYVAAAIVAAVVFVVLVASGVPVGVAQVTTLVTAAGLRAASLHWGWRTPTAYDVWGDLEARVNSRLDQLRERSDARARGRA